ncbi:TPA: replication/maintenance protein RepL, partial [Staphylococcus aureus]|nr:replication/maintenance protein RepL [Staphylococcus aureus]HDZ6125254.1 replication/maintenance protein RepL [Staphylococcus aureus]HEA2842964.1 replication/maintenance protein RepL [Staphylococcus aureus]
VVSYIFLTLQQNQQKYLLLEFGNFEQEANEKQENALSDYYSFKD